MSACKPTCARRPTPSSACTGGWTAAQRRWLAETRSFCVFDTPVGTNGPTQWGGGQAQVSDCFAAEAERARALPYLGDFNPALDDPRPDVRPEPPVLEDCADHAGRHRVELRDGGADGGGAVLAVLLVPLRPDGAQAVVRYHPFKQQLRDRNGLALAYALVCTPTPPLPPHPCPPHSLHPCRSAARPPGQFQRTRSHPGPQALLRSPPQGRISRCRGNHLEAGRDDDTGIHTVPE